MNSKPFQRPNFNPWLNDRIIARQPGAWIPAWNVRPGTDGTNVGVFVRRGVLNVSSIAQTVKLGSAGGAALDTLFTNNFIEVPVDTEGAIYIALDVDDTNPYSLICTAAYVKWLSGAFPANTLTLRHIELARVNATNNWSQTNMFNIEAARWGDYNEIDNMRIWPGP